MLPLDALALGTGAFCGAFCRYQVGRFVASRLEQKMSGSGSSTRISPSSSSSSSSWMVGWHTAGINIVGSFLLGCISQAPESTFWKGGLSARTKLMLGVGFCGSFTTFSTYSVDVVQWIVKGQSSMALKYILVNNVGSIGAAAAGMALVKRVLPR